MAKIIEKRRSLHRDLARQRDKNNNLKYQVGQLQALANIGTSTCMIAHEINNLLTPLSNYAQLALNHPEDGELAVKALKKTAHNCKRASKIMGSILAVANGESHEKKQCRLKMLVDEIFTCLCRDFSKDGISVKIDITEELSVFGVPIEIQQVLMNLILNARDAIMPGKGNIEIYAEENGEMNEIRVSDTGCGIEPDNIEKIFEPFFTTKSDKKAEGQNFGSGLGLAFCKKVIDEHGGMIAVQSGPDGGTVFTVSLPKSN